MGLFVLFGEKETLDCAHCHRQIGYVGGEGRERASMTLLKSKKFPEKKKESQFAWMLISVALHIFLLFSFFLCSIFMSLYVSVRQTEKKVAIVC